MTEIEIDFDDEQLEAPASVDELLDPKKIEEVIEEVKDEVKPEPKKRGPKPKVKDESTPGTTTQSTPEETVEELEEEEVIEERIEESLIQGMVKRLGIELPEGTEFEDSEEGLEEFTNYVSDIKADTKLNEYFAGLPEVAGEFFDYLEMLRDDPEKDEKIKEFFNSVKPEINYKTIDLENVDTQKAIMKTMMKNQGYTDADINEELADMEVAGTLQRQAEKASKILATKQEAEKAILLANQKKESDAKKENTQKFFNTVKQTIEGGKVNNFNIPLAERKAQYEYDASGKFMQDINDYLKDPAKRVELAIALKNGFNLSKYVNVAAATKTALSLRDKVKTGNGKLKGGTSNQGNINSGIDFEEVYEEATIKK